MTIKIQKGEALVVSMNNECIASMDNPTYELLMKAIREHGGYEDVIMKSCQDFDSNATFESNYDEIKVRCIDTAIELDFIFTVILQAVPKY